MTKSREEKQRIDRNAPKCNICGGVLGILAQKEGLSAHRRCLDSKNNKQHTEKMNRDNWEEWEKEEKENLNKIDKLIKQGHTTHCACRQVWGDGVCECKKWKEECLLWVCGKFIEKAESGTVWEFVGVFSNIEAAERVCKGSNYFVAPIEVDVAAPEEPTSWPGSYYPKVPLFPASFWNIKTKTKKDNHG